MVLKMALNTEIRHKSVMTIMNFLKLHDVCADSKAIEKEFFVDDKIEEEIILCKILQSFKFKCKTSRIKVERIEKMTFPFLLKSRYGSYHIALKSKCNTTLCANYKGDVREVNHKDFFKQYTGDVIFAKLKDVLHNPLKSFDISWFIPVIIKYKKMFGEVLLASFFVQAFALVTPLFFQVVIDKILVHESYTTLDVIAVGLFFMSVFDIVLNSLRTYIFTHTTSRMDVELGAKLYKHLLSLPIAYFTSRAVGQTVARVQELDSIRNFLTGNTVTVILDILFMFVFFVVMFSYSPFLTYIVLGGIPFYIILSLFVTPLLRKRVDEMFQYGARSQSFLVESTTGIETLKSMAVEPSMRTIWERQLAAYVKSGFKMRILGMLGSNGVQLISKLTSVAILFFGAKAVMDGNLTIGELIAFNMFQGQVNAPIIRLAQMWQDLQQFRISIDRLGDILNTRGEHGKGPDKPSPRVISGEIVFDRVCFRYVPGGPEILRNITLRIKSGQTIGFVGRSGSGKSTLTKMVQRMYTPERGKVLVDGNDISLVNLSWLRSQIGVVLQENYLFSRTIRENIALTEPSVSLERVVEVAKLAGAHDFIADLPNGYDTVLEERGTNLSGGQRQRIAIARALLPKPVILIFDEATSALDYESERCIQDNMEVICKGRTVLVIAHRLSAVRNADAIYVIDRGQIIESGSHDALLKQKGLYANLYAQQVK